MKDSQLEKMSIKELKDLKKRVDRAILGRHDRKRAELRDKFKQMAAQEGFSWSDFVSAGRGGRGGKRGSVAVKYADPANPANTWTGRGRMPNWLADKIKSGAKREDFAI